MKDLIVYALKNDKKVVFVFDSENLYTADVLIDEMKLTPNFIAVCKSIYESTAYINISAVQRIEIFYDQ
ncbi:hypothetical protein ACSQ34_12350 [Enterococcus mundtii]|uniref:hypothetical protein n=1 Tax=Enterococcus mundtii TaxID=53346 RepID=UPI00403D4AED